MNHAHGATIPVVFAAALLSGSPCEAGPAGEAGHFLGRLVRAARALRYKAAGRRIARRVLGEQGAKALGREGLETLGRIVTRYGDDVAELAAKHGKRFLAAYREFGDKFIAATRRVGPRGRSLLVREPRRALHILNRYGKEALEAEARHPKLVENLARHAGGHTQRVLRKVGPNGYEKLAALYGGKVEPAAGRIVARALAARGPAVLKHVPWEQLRRFGLTMSVATAIILGTYYGVNWAGRIGHRAVDNMTKDHEITKEIGRGARWAILVGALVGAVAFLLVLVLLTPLRRRIPAFLRELRAARASGPGISAKALRAGTSEPAPSGPPPEEVPAKQ